MDFENGVLKSQQKMQRNKQSGNFMALQSQLLARQVQYGVMKREPERDNVLSATSAAISTKPCVLNIEL